MNKQLFSVIKLAVFFLLGSIIILSSCQKEPDLIGMSLQSENEKLGVGFDTSIAINAYSVFDDSLRTDNYSANLFGTFNDPVFGTTSASIFTQLRLSTLNPSFPSTATLDSLVLYLPYSGSYSVSNNSSSRPNPLQLKVYEVGQKMYIDSVYYSNRFLYINENELASLTFTPKPNDSVTIDGVKTAATLRIKLNTTAGKNLGMNLLNSANLSYLADNDVFTKFFKGICIKAFPLNTMQANKGSILYFNLLTASARMSLYYKKTAIDTAVNIYDFNINDKCSKFTNFNHYGYIGTNSTLASNIDFQKQLGLNSFPKDTTLGQQKLYLQSMGGVKVNFKFPNLRDLIKNKKVTINEAVLVIKNMEPDDLSSPPSMLTILKKLADGKTAFLPDIYEGSSFFGGTYNTTKREYRMRITRYLQNMLNTTDIDYGLVMLIDSRRTTANRFVFKGTDKSLTNCMKLELKYTVIK